MQILIGAIGRLKAGPERDLYARYADRFDALGRKLALGPLRLIELNEARNASAEARKSDEGARILGQLPPSAIVALSETGKSITSAAFATDLRRRRDNGQPALAFLIGGPDGHAPDVLARADLTLSFGAMTMPHGLARVVLVEQLYRAATIIANHPYHRA